MTIGQPHLMSDERLVEVIESCRREIKRLDDLVARCLVEQIRRQDQLKASP